MQRSRAAEPRDLWIAPRVRREKAKRRGEAAAAPAGPEQLGFSKFEAAVPRRAQPSLATRLSVPLPGVLGCQTRCLTRGHGPGVRAVLLQLPVVLGAWAPGISRGLDGGSPCSESKGLLISPAGRNSAQHGDSPHEGSQRVPFSSSTLSTLSV